MNDYINIDNCTREFKEIMKHYKQQKYFKQNLPSVQKILDERMKQILFDQTEEEYLIQDFMDNIRLDEEVKELVGNKPYKRKVSRIKKDKMRNTKKRFNKNTILQSMLLPEIFSQDYYEEDQNQKMENEPVLPTISSGKAYNNRMIHNPSSQNFRTLPNNVCHTRNSLVSGNYLHHSTKEIDIYPSISDSKLLRNHSMFKIYERQKKVEGYVKAIEDVENNIKTSSKKLCNEAHHQDIASFIFKKKYKYILNKLS